MEAVDVLGRIERVDHGGQRDPLGQRHLDDDAGDERVGVEPLDLGADGRRRGAARDLDEAALDADLRARLEDLVEVDGRRRVPPDDEDRERRACSRACHGTRATSFSTLARISAAIGAPSRSLGPSPDAGVTRRRTSTARAVSPLRTTSLSEVRVALDLVGELLRAAEQLAGRPVVADRRQVDVDVRRGRARGGDAEQGGHLEVGARVAVAAARERLGVADDLGAGLDGPERGVRRAACRLADRGVRGSGARARCRAGASSPRRTRRIGAGVLVGERRGSGPRASVRRRSPPRGAPRAARTSAGPATGRRPSPRGPRARLPATAAALPPPGTGSADASRSTKAATVRSPKRVLGSTRRL